MRDGCFFAFRARAFFRGDVRNAHKRIMNVSKRTTSTGKRASRARRREKTQCENEHTLRWKTLISRFSNVFLIFRVFLFREVFDINSKFRVSLSRGVPGELRNHRKTLEGSAKTPLGLSGARAARRERKNGSERARARFRASRATPGEAGELKNATFSTPLWEVQNLVYT